MSKKALGKRSPSYNHNNSTVCNTSTTGAAATVTTTAAVASSNTSTITVKSQIWRESSGPYPGRVKALYEPTGATELKLSLLNGVQSSPVKSLTSPVKLFTSMPGGTTPKKSSKSSTFQQYEANTLDAWDDGDDGILPLGKLALDSSVIQTTAQQIIENHSQHKPSPKSTAAQKNAGDSNNSLPKPGSAVKRILSQSESSRLNSKVQKFETLINGNTTNLLEELRQLSWSGIPKSCRPITWKILSGYLPAVPERRKQTLDRKRREYFGFLDQYFGTRHEDQYQDIFRQIHIDVPRMNPLIPLFQTTAVQEIFERILYIWAIRHPASGYVQGINDLVTPFFVVFLNEVLDADVETDNVDISIISTEQLNMIEADSFWCMSKLLDGIQDNYTFAQPGIQKKVAALKDLTRRIDVHLHDHLEAHNIEFLQFSFRWMNNLLMRELPLRCTIRLWDTYLAEPDGFASFHLYVCAAFLKQFSKPLLAETDFQGLMTLLQNLPTKKWQDGPIGELTAEAYRLKYMFADAPQHLNRRT